MTVTQKLAPAFFFLDFSTHQKIEGIGGPAEGWRGTVQGVVVGVARDLSCTVAMRHTLTIGGSLALAAGQLDAVPLFFPCQEQDVVCSCMIIVALQKTGLSRQGESRGNIRAKINGKPRKTKEKEKTSSLLRATHSQNPFLHAGPSNAVVLGQLVNDELVEWLQLITWGKEKKEADIGWWPKAQTTGAQRQSTTMSHRKQCRLGIYRVDTIQTCKGEDLISMVCLGKPRDKKQRPLARTFQHPGMSKQLVHGDAMFGFVLVDGGPQKF